MIAPPDLLARAEALIREGGARGLRLATAESCTGGLIAALLTEVPGSSAVVERGWVTYSNQAKVDELGVPATLIAAHGAVSEAVARAMAEGALRWAGVDAAVAVTGIAGPGGGSAAKPVGLVHLGLARRDAPTRSLERHYGSLGRREVRVSALADALALLEQAITEG